MNNVIELSVDTQRLLQQLQMPPALAIEFLAVFSRLEYALKTRGYVRGDDKEAETWWDKFANDLDHKFNENQNEDLQKAIKYLLEESPKKLILESGGQLKFVTSPPDKKQTTLNQVLLMVRRVRNNLFHGGKYFQDGREEQNRNPQLVQYSLIVLRACIQLHEAVRESYSY